MPRFSANLSFLWPDLDVYDRPLAAADAGFQAVEILFPHELALDRLERALRQAGVELVLFDVPPGPPGQRGLLCLPGRQEECLALVRQGLDMARRFGTRTLNLLAGMLPPDVPRERALAAASDTLRRACDLAQPAGVRLLVENISPAVAEGYFACTVDQAAELVHKADHRAAGLQLDQFHVSSLGADPIAMLEKHLPLVAHVQVADAPGRHQPGTGSAPIDAFLRRLDELDYQGHVGLEYAPAGPMAEALAWLPRELRGR